MSGADEHLSLIPTFIYKPLDWFPYLTSPQHLAVVLKHLSIGLAVLPHQVDELVHDLVIWILCHDLLYDLQV